MARPKLDIVYEDHDLLLANKPGGLLTLPDRFAPEKPNVLGLLNQAYGKVWTVHRLDRETSGIMVFAKNEEAHRELSRQFQEREVAKAYLALADGQIHLEEGEIDRPIVPNPAKPGQMMTARKGKAAFSRYKVLERFQNFTLVEVSIETGRTHQIRVHLQALGHALAIDEFYGRRTALFLSEIKGRNYSLGKFEEERPLMGRLSLHAWKLALQHPSTGEKRSWEAPLPKDFNAVLKQLRKWGKA